MEAVLNIRRRIRKAEHTLEISFILGEEHLRRAFGQQPPRPIAAFLRPDHHRLREVLHAPQLGMTVLSSERPDVPKPHRGQQVELRFLRPAIPCRDLDQNVFRSRFGVFDEHVKITIVIEYPRVHQLEFRIAFSAPPVFIDELLVREDCLRIFIQKLHVGMRGGGIEIEIILFYIFTVIAFVPGEAEQALLQDGIAPVPKRQREAYPLVPVANPANAVFSPAIHPRTRVLVRKIFPGRPVWTVIFSNRSPLPLAQVRSPALPMLGALVRFVQTLFFGCHRSLHSGPVRGNFGQGTRKVTSIVRSE